MSKNPVLATLDDGSFKHHEVRHHSQQLWTAVYSPSLNPQGHLSGAQLPQVGWQESC